MSLVFLRRSLLVVVLIWAALLCGCRSASNLLLQAVALQTKGNNQAALDDYVALLSRVPARDHQLISMLETKIGECLLAESQTREAYVALDRAAKDDPANVHAHLRLGEVMLVASAPSEAMQQARMVLSSDPNNLDALAVFAQGLNLAGKPETATYVFKQILEADPTRVELALQLAEIEVRDGELDAARETLHNAAAAKPHDSAPWLALGRLEEIAAQPDAAERAYRQAVKVEDSAHTELRLAQFLARNSRMEEAENVLRRLSPATTTLPDFDLLAGRAGVAQTEYVQELRRNEAAHGKDSAQLNARVVESILQQSSEPANTNPNAALADAAKWLQSSGSKLSPENEFVLRSELALSQNNLEGASALGQRAVAVAPGSPAAVYVLGVIDQRRGLDAAAEKAYRKSLELDSSFAPAMQALAEIAMKHGNFAAAERYIATVVLDEPENFRALCLYARILEAQNRLDESADMAHRALAADPGAAEPHVLLGDVATRQERLAGALIEYEQALMRDAHSSEAMRSLEQLYAKGRITRLMIAKMERVAASPPASAPLMEIAGRLYFDHGWNSDAERALRAALKFDPERRSAAAVLAQIYLGQKQQASAVAMLNTIDPTAGNLVAASSASNAGSPAAMDQYEEAVKSGDRSGVAANNLAWNYAMHGRQLDRALQLAQLAHDLAPQNPRMLDTLGVVRLHRREYSDAIATLKQAVDLARAPAAGNSPQVLNEIEAHLRDAYRLSGQQPASEDR